MIKTFLVTNPSEYQMALSIRKAVFIEEQQIPESIEIDSFENVAHHFLALFDNIPAGAARLRPKGGKVKFERIATLKEFRGRGVGTSLVSSMLEFCRKHYPGQGPVMHAQLEAIEFYEKLGWRAIGDVFFEADIPHKVLIID